MFTGVHRVLRTYEGSDDSGSGVEEGFEVPEAPVRTGDIQSAKVEAQALLVGSWASLKRT